uniref:Mitotic spindle assembly checkpoint protein MAD1 n=1 Tax=Aplanochytrium stocchinoi TaxID=215587 RepID=A0A7S3PFY6_9STRA
MERLQERSGQMVAAEVERDALLAERRDWDRHFLKLQKDFSAIQTNNPGVIVDENTPPTSTSVHQAIKFLQDLQNECVYLTKAKGNAELQLKKYEREINNCQQELLLSQSKVASLEESKSQLEDIKVAAEKESLYLRREVNSLLRVIESTGKEAGMTSGGKHNKLENVDNIQKAEALDKQLANAKDRIKELEAEGVAYRNQGASPAVVRTARKRNEELQNQVLAYEKEKQKLTTALEKAEAKVAELEHHVSRGSYNPSKEKVVHMTMNPERVLRNGRSNSMEEEIKRLKRANAVLTEKFNDLIAGNPTATLQADNFSPLTSTSGSNQQDLGKRHERLKELFKQKTKAFREAVYLLTGFMIDMTQDQNPQLRVRSMFAEREDDHLLFKWQPDVEGGLHLLETDFCSRIDENIFAYLKKCNSVPAFLSTLTLDLFEKQTFLL